MTAPTNVLAFDVGSKRTGLARINSVAKIAEPLGRLEAETITAADIEALVKLHEADLLVVGLPRNQSGEETKQTLVAREFGDWLIGLNFEVVYQDESVTSIKARQLIDDGVYPADSSVDSVSAAIIAEDYISNDN